VVLAFIFFGVTILLTKVNQDISAKKSPYQLIPKARVAAEQNHAGLFCKPRRQSNSIQGNQRVSSKKGFCV
jgi:hypothetical protein